jgi:membrane protein YqaA with SNARE-associated domain
VEETLFLQGAGLLGLAISGFLSATLLPGSSEALLLIVVSQGTGSAILPVAVASLANTLGGLSTYWLGLYSKEALVRRGKIVEPSSRAVKLLKRWGAPLLVLSWLPVIGDGLCLAAGWLKMNFLLSTLAIFFGKTLRYCVLVYWLLAL